jgi:hypothetical protein
VPPGAIAFYARWWQLETWLRQLAYIELRAKYGTGWLNHLVREAPSRRAKDEINAYMETPDASNALAYLDFPDLLALISSEEHWPLFEPSLVPRARWLGTTDELVELRNRNAHCRRPHDDDLRRVEQVLRNLEKGARVALEAFNRRGHFNSRMEQDGIARGWILKEHEDAARLVDHCLRQYDTELRLEWSARPWASGLENSDEDLVVAGREGLFVHATFSMGGRRIRLQDFWRDYFGYRSPLSRRLVYFVVDLYTPSFSFAAVDGAEKINDVIGMSFDAVITGSHRATLELDEIEAEFERLEAIGARLDPRVQVGTALTAAYEDQPFRVFEADAS